MPFKVFSYEGVPISCGIQMSLLISAYVLPGLSDNTLFGSLYGNTAIIVAAENISIILIPGFLSAVCGLLRKYQTKIRRRHALCYVLRGRVVFDDGKLRHVFSVIFVFMV